MDRDLIAQILELKKQKNAIILAHNYMRPEIFEVADAVGDSFELSKAAQEMECDIIVFAGVHFMAESAKLLNPSKKVLIPSLAAGCFMADTITAEGLKRLKAKYPHAPVVVYMNTSAEVKALSTSTCTSSNAVKIVDSFAEDTIIFAPDKHLCEFVQDRTKKTLIPWAGFCHVHTQLSPAMLQRMKEKYPQGAVLLHPESPKRLFSLADHICGTGGMSKYIAEHPEIHTFLIGTEEGMVGRLKRDFPDREFVALMGTCINMKQITLENIARSLEHEKYEITVQENIFDAAQKSLLEMMERGI
ncbi:MAG: quinolinate synthase NadA [Candidatus Peregrinibacteria bacterium]